MMDVFGQCTDACGWMAAIVAALSYGSFGVPIKQTKDIDVHPLVLQSYKTFVMFLTCWGVIFLGVDVAFTKWGLLSGLLWVVGGTGGIYAIRMAGLAIAVGTWASIMIMVNFVFGIMIFQEPVKDIWGTLASFLMLIVGLVGMSHYSAQQPQTVSKELDDGIFVDEVKQMDEPLTKDEEDLSDEEEGIETNEGRTVLFGHKIHLTKRQCGILGAVWNGVFTGCSLIPLHYAKEEGFGGARFIISMSCGAFISNILIWVILFAYWKLTAVEPNTSMRHVYDSMPPLHFSKLWFPGFLAGLLLSLAMFGSILAVTYLGQGVGNSLVQTKILISGLWGIFWFKEITGTSTILKWFLSAAVAVAAIIWLSLERLLATGHSDH